MVSLRIHPPCFQSTLCVETSKECKTSEIIQIFSFKSSHCNLRSWEDTPLVWCRLLWHGVQCPVTHLRSSGRDCRRQHTHTHTHRSRRHFCYVSASLSATLQFSGHLKYACGHEGSTASFSGRPSASRDTRRPSLHVWKRPWINCAGKENPFGLEKMIRQASPLLILCTMQVKSTVLVGPLRAHLQPYFDSGGKPNQPLLLTWCMPMTINWVTIINRIALPFISV